MNSISIDKIKVALREAGVKVQPRYDYGHIIIVSSALKQEHKTFITRKTKELGILKSQLLNRYILGFKPVEASVKFKLSYDAAKSTAGFLDSKVTKTFGNRANIKFTSFSVDKHNYHKLNELSEYYGISRSAVIRLIIDYNMEK